MVGWRFSGGKAAFTLDSEAVSGLKPKQVFCVCIDVLFCQYSVVLVFLMTMVLKEGDPLRNEPVSFLPWCSEKQYLQCPCLCNNQPLWHYSPPAPMLPQSLVRFQPCISSACHVHAQNTTVKFLFGKNRQVVFIYRHSC